MKVRGRTILAVKRHVITTDGVMGAELHAFLTSGVDGGNDQSVEDKQLGWQCMRSTNTPMANATWH